MDTVKKYIKNIDNINANNIMSPCLPQSKLYLKILGIPYLHNNSPTPISFSQQIKEVIQRTNFFKNITLASKLHIIKASSKLDMAVIWIDIWDL